MDIPIKAAVLCKDGECGRVSKLVINPASNDLTHVVVEENYVPHKERIVPVDVIKNTSANTIILSCTKDEFIHMDNFKEHAYYPEEKSYNIFPVRPRVYIPYSSFNTKYAEITKARIPAGEVTFDIGASVEAEDGRVGKVDEFLIDPHSEHITHLVMSEGHLWNKKEIAIPVAYIEHINEDAVVLNISKDQIEALPSPLTVLDGESEERRA